MTAKTVPVFDEAYYRKVIADHGYDPLRFGEIDFSIGSVTPEELKSKWICHNQGKEFAERLLTHKSVVLSGVGLSSVPHIGTLTQILSMKFLNSRGIPVEFVLGDLDAFNGKNTPFNETRELAERYKNFIRKLGFVESETATIRDQFSRPDVTHTMYIAGHYMADDAFDATEEDLHSFYAEKGKVEAHMSFRRKLSLALMVADFADLLYTKGYTNLLVTLGLDEHKYVAFAQQVVQSMITDSLIPKDALLACMYSPLISGFNDYPKMSKSFPESSINLAMSDDEIRTKIMDHEGKASSPLINPVYQMMLAIGGYSHAELLSRYNACEARDENWNTYKLQFVDQVIPYVHIWQTA